MISFLFKKSINLSLSDFNEIGEKILFNVKCFFKNFKLVIQIKNFLKFC